MRIIIYSAGLLVIWSCINIIVVQQQYEALISAMRIFLESALIYLIINNFSIKRKSVATFIIIISLLNALVASFQLLESIGLINIKFNEIALNFWDTYEEAYRKQGFLNSILTSSCLYFISIPMVINYYICYSRITASFFLLNIFFGSRLFLILSMPIILINFKKYIQVILFFLVIFLAFKIFQEDFYLIFEGYFFDRIYPVIHPIFDNSQSLDYSIADLYSQYKFPNGLQEFILGNGYNRYHDLGGADPLVTRWLLQTGFPSLILVLTIVYILLYKIYTIRGSLNKIMSLGLFISIFKAELVTATGLYSLLLLYAFSDEN